ncbi:MAG: divergent polysaccharide deacetylase family protein [Acetobacteraceae bacterium]|nr:divergent polysaccharide deacetylase family protein [Acetobacteraceae bacterium]
MLLYRSGRSSPPLRPRAAAVLALVLCLGWVLAMALVPAPPGAVGHQGAGPGSGAAEGGEALPGPGLPPPGAVPGAPGAGVQPAPESPDLEPAPGEEPGGSEAAPGRDETVPRWGGEGPMPPEPAGAVPRLALVVDDLGWGVPGTEEMLSLDPAVTLAFLPGSPHGVELAERAAALGHEVLVHIPMESSRPEADPGPGALRVGMSAAEVADLVDRALGRFPQAVGVNNHMGSKAMGDAALMDALMAAMERRGLFFLDSASGPGSAAGPAAAAHGVPLARNDLFLDNVRQPEAIRARLDEAAGLAARRGWAVAICHPSPAAAQVLAAELPRLAAAGVKLVPVSALVQGAPRPAPGPASGASSGRAPGAGGGGASFGAGAPRPKVP